MLNFISSAFATILGFITGSWQTAITEVVTSIRDMFQAEHSYWQSVAQNVRNGWQQLTRGHLVEREGLSQFMDAQYMNDVKVQKHQIPWLANWIAWLGAKTKKDLADAVTLLTKRMDDLYNKNHAFTEHVLAWILIHVLKFLYGLVSDALGWIGGIGSTMWHYFSHLDEFAMLLFWHIVTSLETLAWDVGKRLGTFFLSLVVHNIVRFSTLMESVIDAVL